MAACQQRPKKKQKNKTNKQSDESRSYKKARDSSTERSPGQQTEKTKAVFCI